GNISVGLWHGAGYAIITQSQTTISITNKISGGLSGGFIGDPITIDQAIENTAWQLNKFSYSFEVATALTLAHDSQAPVIAEPVDGVTGVYLYDHTDLTTGGGSFPYALPFARNYTSSNNTTDVGLGNGWAHSYNIAATRGSDPFVGMGASSS